MKTPAAPELKGDASALTGRQREVLQLIREGKGIKEIAALLNISVKTVQFHKNCLMQELNLRTTMALMRYGITEGLVTDRPEPSSSLTPN